MASRVRSIGFLIIAVVVLVVYHPALAVGFVGDDWTFVGAAAATPPLEYLWNYFNPFYQVRWYRPVQGLQYGIEYALFAGNAAPYHLAHILFHLAATCLLFDLTRRITGNWRVGFLGALSFAGLSAYGWSVLWVADVAPLQTLLAILTLWLWWRYLQFSRRSDYVLTFIAFLAALLSKESSVTLPFALVLLESFARKSSTRALIRRYIPFFVTLIGFLLIESAIIQFGAAARAASYAYGIGGHLFSNLIYYLARLVFPWNLPPPFNVGWLIFAALIYFALVWRKRRVALAALGLIGLLAILPFLPNAGAGERYFYSAAMVSAIFLALLFENVCAALPPRRGIVALASASLALIMIGDAGQIADRAASLADLARFNRAPLRAVTQKHPAFPPDTLIYFIDSAVPSADLSGMFYLRYGANGVVSGTDRASPADFAAHSIAYVYYADEQGELREQPVNHADVRIASQLPVVFAPGIRLEGIEIANAQVKRGDAVVLLMYWRATAKIDQDNKIFAHLVNAKGERVDGFDGEPRGGKFPTSQWIPGQLVVDWAILNVADAPAGDYHLEVGLYHAPTMRRLAVLDADGNPVDDKITISPLRILP
ncbi:MAG: glycosyltransferase family 39 protein [Chloroflexi bacterium]|nr:glycosyltransferase family 39 protein [Chloroflexota bacterium]